MFRPEFNRSITVVVAAQSLTEDTGALPLREVADQLGLDELARALIDPRDPSRITHPLTELLRTRVLMMAQGYRDQDDADLLREDPALRVAVSDRKGESPLLSNDEQQPDGLASQPTFSRLQAMLAGQFNLRQLHTFLLSIGLKRMRQAHGRRKIIILDVDSFPREVHGSQEGAAYNGHYKLTIYHPLIAITDTGDILGVQIRPGNLHTADEVRAFLSPILAALKQEGAEVWVRMDAGYADGAFHDWLRARGVQFLVRLKNNPLLERRVQKWRETTLAKWAAEPPPAGELREATREFWYRAKSWTRAERVVAVLVERDAGQSELFHKSFFLCTSLSRPKLTSQGILSTYRQRGTGEGYIGDYVGVLDPSLSSAARPRKNPRSQNRPVGMAENEVNLLLGALAYELMHAVRCLLEEVREEGLSLRRLRERVLKVATVVVRHARRIQYRIGSSKEAWWRQLVAVLPRLAATAPEVNA